MSAMPQATLQERLKRVKHVILVLSGKGGVGKSSVSTLLALSLAEMGHKVGLLDIDLCGPSIPTMVGLQNHRVHQSTEGWIPVYADEHQRLGVMSIGFLLSRPDESVVWRGPKKTSMIKQFLSDVFWGDLDYLIVDTPPGTSDEHIAMAEYLQGMNPDGAVIVTTPQGVALADVRKEIKFCQMVGIPIIGIIENMSGFACPHCAECTNIFSTGGGEALAKEVDAPFLGRIPIDPKLTACFDSGKNFIQAFPESGAHAAFTAAATSVKQQCEAAASTS